MHWILLTLAIVSEVAATSAMKLSSGFTRLLPTILMFLMYLTSLVFLNFSLKGIPMSVAYAIWSGLGTALIVVISYFFFAEQITPLKTISIVLIVTGIIGLNLGGSK